MTSYVAIADSDIDPESPITTTLMTRLRDNAVAIGEADLTVPSALSYGKLIAFHTITASNAVWAPNAKTKKLIIQCVGGGGNGAAGNAAVNPGMGGGAGGVAWAHIASPSGTYNITVGAAGQASSIAGIVLANGGPHALYGGERGYSYNNITTATGVIGWNGGGLGGVGTSSGTTAGGNGLPGGYGAGGGGGGGPGNNDQFIFYGKGGGGGSGAGGGNGGTGGAPTGVGTVYGLGGAGGSGIVYIWEYT